ncbi:MAG: class I SAM-dependent methyltransferase [Xanthobacteraceae bacterium]|nr:class I SAM-dependent methyltransferase [Xanthobacteraceae bacterium]
MFVAREAARPSLEAIGEGGSVTGKEPVCPACLGNHAQPILSVSAQEAALHFVSPRFDAERNDRILSRIRSLWGSDQCRILECQNCGFGFSWPFVAGDAAFYNLTGSDAVYPKVKWEFSRTVEALALRDTSDARILEVGAGNGFFLDRVSPRLIRQENVTAVEYNERSITTLKRKGYEALTLDIRDKPFDGRGSSFDFIFMFQVIEHLDRIDELFERVRFLLKPGGSAFCAVPNVKRIAYQESHGSLLDMPPNHIGRWTPQAFREVSSRLGLRVAATEVEPLDWMEFFKHDISYSHIRRTQIAPAGALAKIRSWPRGRRRRLAEAAAAALGIPARLSSWADAWKDRKIMGGSLWIQLDRI